MIFNYADIAIALPYPLFLPKFYHNKMLLSRGFRNFPKLFYFPRKLVNRPFADEVRLVVTLFPLADGVCANADGNRKIRLCQLGGLPYALDERSVGFFALNFHSAFFSLSKHLLLNALRF